jgi:flavin reductase (DIM6/NTAB) family NADH-FMN oxidoreductase RutF
LNLKALVKRKLFGYTLPHEYLCLSSYPLLSPLRIFLTSDRSARFLEVSNQHILLGYKPLVIGILFSHEDAERFSRSEVCLSFQICDFEPKASWRGFSTDVTRVATLTVKKVSERVHGNKVLCIFTGTAGHHFFLPSFNQYINRARESFKALKKGNVYLPGNLYEQVKVAYAVPREISVITIGKDGQYNMFPTDLHGPVNDDFYASSLRKDGKACEQVDEIRRLCISSVDADWSGKAYALGKNHMKDLSDLKGIELHEKRSEKFNLPLPAAVISYRELQVIESFDEGIHRIFFYKIVHQQIFNQEKPALRHIHRYYAQWRESQGLKTEYTIR